ncbi:amidohydrolase [Trinickia sp. NRRL B-1857]|uniref:amidohydrolase n=1 Tax=Trinickia sp. NRRL B-1857 TaxID=3162879 RepID=UPI003D2C2689
MSFSLAIINAKRLWTGLTSHEPEINAIGIEGERITAIAGTKEILARCTECTEIIDAHGQFVMPGFTDSHCHFLDGGLRLLSVQLRDVSSREQFSQRVAEFVRNVPEGTWVIGGDWDHHNWGGLAPDKSWLDAVAPKHPVWLNRMDGHMALANSAALAIAGLSRDTEDVVGGEIGRYPNGELTGLLKDNAMNLVIDHIPPRSQAVLDSAVDAAMDYVAARGITCVHTMVTVDCADGLWPRKEILGQENFEPAYTELATYEKARAENRLRTRIHAALPLNSVALLKEHVDKYGRGDAWLKIDSVKAMIDGSLGTHTAAMQEDYDDTPGYRGYLLWDTSTLASLIRQADAAGFQIKMHAIGDRGIHEMLDLFEQLIRTTTAWDRRLRCEHAQHFLPDDIARFAKLGIIASVQPSHLADDGRWACSCIGFKRLKTSWPMRSLLDEGAVLALGSDWFVTPPHPLEGIHAAVTRQTIDGKHPEGLVPQECISMEEALIGYTQGAAFAGGVENDFGTLEPGKFADIAILDTDILSQPPSALLNTQVSLTMVGAKTVYDAGTLKRANRPEDRED